MSQQTEEYVRRLERTLVKAALPLEALFATECDAKGRALADELKGQIVDAVRAIRRIMPEVAKAKPSEPLTHIEYPMFSKKLLCGLPYKQAERYTWAIDTILGWSSVTCKECRRIAREQKLDPTSVRNRKKMSEKIVSCTIGPYPRPMPLGMFDPMPKVKVKTDAGNEIELFDFYPDELRFSEAEFIGLTIDQGRDLKRKKDVSYLKS
jgi:hypothetical protein